MSGQPKSVVIGTAGHIDHGKTTLIRALTGIDADRLPEEKRRGITIDLGFASLDAESPDGSQLRISFVDVPGHKSFVRNMLAGAGGIDAVMMVVSAEEGVKPQTEEHLAICNLLGVRRGLTIITKSDAVDSSHLEATRAAVRDYLSGTFLAVDQAPLLSVSAYSGEGIEKLKRALIRVADQAPPRSTDTLPRLPLDRSFVMRGFGTVVTGTLLSGTIHEGESLVLEPGRRAVRVRGLQIHGHPEQYAQAGSRVALNLTGVDAIQVQRGQTIVLPDTLSPVESVDVQTTLLPDSPELKHRARVHFHAFTTEVMATVALFEYEPARAGTTRLMRLKLSKAVVLLPGDHFVLRQSSPALTIGGGRVLDAHPVHNQRKGKCLAWLEELKESSMQQQILLRIARRNMQGLSLSSLAAETGQNVEALRRLVEPLVDASRLEKLSRKLLLTREAIQSSVTLVAGQLKDSSKFLDGIGLKRSELKSLCGLPIEVFDFVLETLTRNQVLELRDEMIYPYGWNAEATNPDSVALSVISKTYETAGLAAPLSTDVATNLAITEREMRRLMTLLLRERILVRMGSDNLYIHSSALSKLKVQVKTLSGQTIDISRFKQLTGLSRKYAIPLLEYLDREHVTRKQGDHRLVL
jgi:selenocysteine-specific elongation factor